MPRAPRKRSGADVYHVAIRGVGRVIIFEDDDDRRHFIELLEETSRAAGGELYAWCLMSNHVHLLFHLELESLSECMKRLESSYASYFNRRHSRVGHLFQGRFSSEAIGDDAYLLVVLRYIHQNPLHAGICPTESYRWSSYGEYVGIAGVSRLCSTDKVLEMLGGREGFAEFHHAEAEGLTGLAEGGRLRDLGDDEARRHVAGVIGEKRLRELPSLPRAERDPIIGMLLSGGMTIRQIERVTGVSRGVIQRVRLRET